MPNRAKILLILGSLLPVSLCVAKACVEHIRSCRGISPIYCFSTKTGLKSFSMSDFPASFCPQLSEQFWPSPGATLQGIFRNPLADPGLIGVTAGAGLGAAIWIVLIGGGFLGIWGVPVAAFAGGVLVTIGVWKIAQAQGRVLTVTLLLARDST